jgi:predicted nucleotidyltransferase
MKKNLMNLSGKIDNQRVDAIAIISQIAISLRIPFFLIGATARDMLLAGHDIPTYRATLDIDVGAKVPNWEKFNKLKKGLVETGIFTLAKEEQRLKYKGNIEIDIIPFGAISSKNQHIIWPSQETVMHVLGFEETYKHAQFVRLRSKPALDVKLVTLPGLAVMKIFSWRDKYPERKKDATDLFLIIRHYTDAGNFERIPAEMPDLLESDDFDYVRAGARLLGRDIANILNPATKKEVLDIIERETAEQDRYRLIEDMLRSDIGRISDFDSILSLLEELKTGILERH